jgi:hypothetical protein
MEETITHGIGLHQIKNFKEYESIIKDMICCLCLNVVYKPVECYECETLVCEDCFQILLISGKNCMTFKCKGNIRKANKFVREILSNLKISCIYCLNGEFSYPDYNSHLNKCEVYQNSSRYKLFKDIKDKEVLKEIETTKLSISSETYSKCRDPYINLSKDELRKALITFNLPIGQKMELYNSCIEGKIEVFKNLVINKNFPLLEEVSAHNYYWTSFHYAMHYGQWEIIKFICETLEKMKILESSFKLESNDNRCPLLCLMRSNSLDLNKKADIFSRLLQKYPNIPFSNELKKEIKTRGLENVAKKYNKL